MAAIVVCAAVASPRLNGSAQFFYPILLPTMRDDDGNIVVVRQKSRDRLSSQEEKRSKKRP
jgi:hypothetical protein